MTIGDVAQRAGVHASTLRAWEERHGFPLPQRLPSGHRRYPAAVVAQIRAVLERQRAGMSLPAAIRAITDGATPPTEHSLFAALAEAERRSPVRLTRRTMLAFSRAIEDACLAAGGATAIVGAFQHERVYRGCEPRWSEMARGACLSVALADFAAPGGANALVEVPIDMGSPLQREWAVAVAGPRLTACLAGWEWPDRTGGHFEALWSVEPSAVAAVIARGHAHAHAAAPTRVPAVAPITAATASAGDLVADAMRLIDRVVERLDRARHA